MMATFQQRGTFYRPSALNLDQHAYFDEDDEGVLDENILGQHSGVDTGLDVSSPTDMSRRESYSLSTASVFSPRTQDWQSPDLHIQPSASNNNPFSDHQNNSFMNAAASSMFGSQWGMEGQSASHTPLQPYDGLPGEFDGGNTHHRTRSSHGQTPFSSNGTQVQLFSPSATTSASMPNSPTKDHEIGVDNMDYNAMPKRIRHGQSGSGIRSHSSLLRRDGIRKKNARFEIPAERNLQNIDDLINESKDDQEIKELKQQKRLLRNRQAALDSRQRKKLHTERLEDEKKQYNNVIQDLETEVMTYKQQIQELLYRLDCSEVHNNQLIMDKEDLIRNHTQETNDLRKKVNVLTETVHRLESTTMSAAPSSTGFALSDFDNLTMDTWEFFGHDTEVKHEPTMSSTNVAEVPTVTVSDDKSPAQGILMMILLFGAFVATRTQAPGIPRMSEDVRAASATLLEDVFKEAGVASDAPSTTVSSVAPLRSSTIANDNNNIWSTAPSTIYPNDLSSFGAYADSLSLPSEAQQNEQLFSLTPAQYNSVASPSFLHNLPEPSGEVSQGRRNIAESLAAMRRKSKDKNAADVYTRSLLWDQVPQDVVRSFAKLVEEQERNGHNHNNHNIDRD